MTQSTLKRALTAPKPASKRSKAAADGAGSSRSAPIDLDGEDDDDDDERELIDLVDSDTPVIVEESTSKTPLARSYKPSGLSGPSTKDPLCVVDPAFDVKACFTGVEAQVIRKNPDLDLLFFKKLIGGKELFEYLLHELPWYRVTYQTRGMTIRTPRWTCVWGCDETGAPPSAYKIKPRPIPNALKAMLEVMQEKTGAKYNFVLCNYYENGMDSISWHSDDESFLGPLPCIASLSLGSPRDFQMKHKEDKSAKVEKWSLQSGDCVVMRGLTQSRWLHSIPKRANAGGRMNLTFRRAMVVGGTNNYYRYNVFDGAVHRWRDGKMVQVP